MFRIRANHAKAEICRKDVRERSNVVDKIVKVWPRYQNIYSRAWVFRVFFLFFCFFCWAICYKHRELASKVEFNAGK